MYKYAIPVKRKMTTSIQTCDRFPPSIQMTPVRTPKKQVIFSLDYWLAYLLYFVIADLLFYYYTH